jgi:hypothetical protein
MEENLWMKSPANLVVCMCTDAVASGSALKGSGGRNGDPLSDQSQVVVLGDSRRVVEGAQSLFPDSTVIFIVGVFDVCCRVKVQEDGE